MREALRTLVHDFGWIHLSLGLLGNLTFVVGSVLFLPAYEALKVAAVWLFIVGSFLMFVGSLGQLLVKLIEAPESSSG